MEGIEKTGGGGARRSVGLSAWRQVAVFAVAAVSVVVFVRLGKYLGQRFGFSPPLMAALVPIVPTAGAALIAKKVLTPRVEQPPRDEEEVDLYEDYVGEGEPKHITAEGANGRWVLTGDDGVMRVRLLARKSGLTGYSPDEWDIKWAAKNLLKHTSARNYKCLKEKSIELKLLRDKDQVEIVLKGYCPADNVEAEALIRRAIAGKKR